MQWAFERDLPACITIVLAVGLLLAIAVLSGTAHAAPWNPVIYAPDGQTYEEHIADGEAFITQVREYAIAHCGQQYMPSCEGWR